MEVKIIHGAPASGKNFYVSAHAKYGDMIVDLDAIKAGLFHGFGAKVYNDALANRAALAVRETCLRQIRAAEWSDKTAWVITATNDPDTLYTLAEKLDAELIYIDATKEECLERALADPERTDKGQQIEIITRWFCEE